MAGGPALLATAHERGLIGFGFWSGQHRLGYGDSSKEMTEARIVTAHSTPSWREDPPQPPGRITQEEDVRADNAKARQRTLQSEEINL